MDFILLAVQLIASASDSTEDNLLGSCAYVSVHACNHIKGLEPSLPNFWVSVSLTLTLTLDILKLRLSVKEKRRFWPVMQHRKSTNVL